MQEEKRNLADLLLSQTRSANFTLSENRFEVCLLLLLLNISDRYAVSKIIGHLKTVRDYGESPGLYDAHAAKDTPHLMYNHRYHFY